MCSDAPARASLGRELSLDVVEPFSQEGTLDVVVGEGQCLLVRLGRGSPQVKLTEEVGAGRAEVAVCGQRGLGQQRRQGIEAGPRAVT
jgi:hypothetical protein